jgi:hypothetical protein
MKRSLSPCVAVSISSRRSAEEHQTSDEVARLLTEWGYEVHRGLAGTGVVGSLTVGSGQRRLGLRADMDALPMQEASGKPGPVRSMVVFTAAVMTDTPPRSAPPVSGAYPAV